MSKTSRVDDADALALRADGAPRAPSTYRALLQRYASYAATYDRRWARYTAATLERAAALLALDRVDSMLDVACGTGILLAMARDARPGLAIMGLDLSPDMLQKARQRIPEDPRVRWAHGSAERIPAANSSFDLLTCTNAFHLVQRADAALEEFRRVLRPGGAVVIVDWCLDFAAMRLLAAWLRLADRQVRHIRTLDQMVNLLRSHLLEVEHAERFRATRLWGLMAIRARLPADAAHPPRVR